MRLLGSLSLLGQYENVRVENVSSLPGFNSEDEGRLVYSMSQKSYFYNNGTEWLSLGSEGGTRPVRVAVIGDSLAAQNYCMAPSWPSLLETALRQSTVGVSLFNFAVPASTFYRAYTQENNGITQVQKAIAIQPDLVIVALGLNDTMNAVDGRTVTQAKADAALLFETLRQQCPNAKILYMGERPYDVTNFATPATTLLNKGVMGRYFTKRTTGILSGCYSVEILDDPVSAGTRQLVADWIELDTYIRGLGIQYLDASGTIDLFRIHRMGAAVYDMLHLTPAAHILSRAYVIKAILGTSDLKELFPGLTENPTALVNDPDSLFASMFQSDGNQGWTLLTSDANVMSTMDSLWRLLRPQTWYLPLNVQASYSHDQDRPLIAGSHSTISRRVTGAYPNTAISVSVNGAAFVASDTKTNAYGAMESTNSVQSMLSYGVGNTTFRYKINDIVLDPYVFTLAVQTPAPKVLSSSRTLTLQDAGSVLENSSGTKTLTIPTFASAPIHDAPIFIVCRNGSAVTLSAASGVTLLRRSDRATQTLTGMTTVVVELRCLSLNVWVAYGELG